MPDRAGFAGVHFRRAGHTGYNGVSAYDIPGGYTAGKESQHSGRYNKHTAGPGRRAAGEK